MYKKSISFVYIFAFNYQFFNITPSGYAYKVENWHTLSDDQKIFKHRFLDICHCLFKYQRAELSRIEKKHLSEFWAVAELLRKQATDLR